MKSITIYFSILLSISLFSDCQINNEVSSKAETPNLIETRDTAFKFIDQIYSMFEDSNGNFWIGSRENGVCKYHNKTFTYFTTDDGLANNSIPSIQEDLNGNIWIDGGKKITKFDGNKFITFEKKNIAKIDFRENPINISESDLWFKHENDFGIYRFDSKQLSFIEIEEPIPNKINGRLGFGITGVTKIINDKIWFGSSYAGAFGFDGGSFEKISNETLGLNIKKEFMHIRSILADSKGNLWIGNNGIGVLLKDEDSIINFSKEQEKLLDTNEPNLSSNHSQNLQAVFAIEEDKDGNIWFGDRDSGAWRYDGKELKNYNINNTLKEEGIIWDIYNDKNGNLWFIFTSGVVYKFVGESFEKLDSFFEHSTTTY